MNQILAMTRKELYVWAKKPGSWVVVFVVPLLFIWIMQAVFGSSGMPVVSVYAVNEDESQESQRVMEALAGAENLKVEIIETRSEADRRVGAGDRMAAVIVPEGFGTALSSPGGSKIEIIIDPARSEQANIVVGLVNAALGPFIVDAEVTRGVEASVSKIFGGVIPSEPIATPQSAETPQPTIEPTIDATITVEDNLIAPTVTMESTLTDPTVTVEGTLTDPNIPLEPGVPTPELPGIGQSPPDHALKSFFIAAMQGVISSQVQDAIQNPQVRLDIQPVTDQKKVRTPSLLDYLVPGYSLMFMFFLIPNLASTVVEERQTGTLRRLLSAPVPRSQILLGKMLPYFMIAIVQMTSILIVSQLIFGIDLGNTPVAIAILIICSALAMSGLGILVAALARSEGQANGLATVIVLAMAVISGAMFPNIAIPGAQMITPHYWAMQGFLNVIARGQGIEGILLPAGVLLTMAVLFFTFGAIRFRFE